MSNLTPVRQGQPTAGRLYHQRAYAAGDAFAAGDYEIWWDAEGPDLTPPNAAFSLEGVGVLTCGNGIVNPDLWLVGVLLGSPVNSMFVHDQEGTPLDFIKFDGSVSIPVRTMKLRLDLSVEVGAANGDFLFELVFADLSEH